jgi:predicted kinase
MILIVFGLPATGKSYLSKRAAKEFGAVHLNTDVIRKKINKQGQYDEQSKELVYSQMMKEMIRHAQNKEHVIVDGTFQKKLHRVKFGHEACLHAREVYFVETRALEKTIKKRLHSDREYSEADYEVYLKIKNSFEPMTEPHLVLWTDENDVEKLIQELKIYIDGQRTSS